MKNSPTPLNPQNNISTLPLHDEHMEASLIGALLRDNSQIKKIPNLSDDDFCQLHNRRIFDVLMEYHREHQQVDAILLKAPLKSKYGENEWNVLWLAACEYQNNASAPVNAPTYTKRILALSFARKELQRLEAEKQKILNGEIDFSVEVKEPQLTCYSIREFLEINLKPRENIINPWFPTQGLVMVYAPRGVGKTYFALTLAVSIASGSHCFCWEVPRPRGVLYLDGEMPAAAMQERLAKLIKENPGEVSASLKLITRDLNPYKPFSLNTSEGQHEIEKHLEGVEVIIVDNISTLCPVKENDADAWTPIQAWALQMRARGISVLFIHHSNKSGTARGTSRREDILDTVIALRRPPDYSPNQGAVFELHFEKSRGFAGADADAIQLMLNENGGSLSWETTTVERTTYEKVIALTNENGLTPQQIAEELRINKSTVSRHLKNAKAEGKLNAK